VVACLALAIGATGCGEKPQVKVAGANDLSAFKGTTGPYGDAGWKPGDQVSWEGHLRARAQYGQNEYSRTGDR